MKTVKFTTWERIQLTQCVPPQDSVHEVRKHLRVLRILELTPEERKKVGWVMTTDGAISWQDTRHEFELEFEDADFEHLCKLIDKREAWPTMPETAALLDKIDSVKEDK